MTESRRRSILEAASKDAELVAQVSPVVAAGFGVLPLRRLGDVLTVACLPRTNRQALRLLRDVLELEIVATPFEDGPLHEAIRAAYFPDNEESVNFPTFANENFLEATESVDLLRREKIEDPGPLCCDLAEDQLAVANLTYRSTLWNTDSPRSGGALPDPKRTRVDLGPLNVGWRQEEGVPHLYLPEGLDPKTRLILTQYRLSEYRHLQGHRMSEHHVARDQIAEPPLVIHPTEVQLTGLDAEGGLIFHVYDHTERILPDQAPARLKVDYHFLSYGNRMRREIEIQLHEIQVFPRDMLELHRSDAPWGPMELARWFGLPED